MDNINDIINSLSSEDIDMLKGVASSILGGEEKKKEPAAAGNKQELAPNPLNISQIDFDMMMKAKTIFEKMNSTPNKNADLIMALKPHLSPATQNKADQALRILRLFEILPLLKDLF